MPANAAATQSYDAEAEIRAGMQEWKAALLAQDVDALMKHYADNVRLFDIGAPLQYKNKETLREKWTECFAMFGGTLKFEINDLDIDASGDIAHCNCLNHISGKIQGMDISNWVRVTTCHRKIDGVWKVTHEHVSVPVDMKTGTVAFNLEP